MGQRKLTFSFGEFYHLYNRGVEKRVIFVDREDYSHFLYLLYLCNTAKSISLRDIEEHFDRGEPIISIGAFCLMPNHFHLLVKETVPNGISTYMRKLLTSYSMYFNKKYNRTGKLYENVFKATHLDTDNYLKYMYAYIHLNPAKLIDANWRDNTARDTKKLLDYISTYLYSSIVEYLKDKYRVVNPTEFPEYFSSPEEHKAELFSWLNFESPKEFPL